MVLNKVIVAYSENRTKPVSTFYRQQKSELPNVKTSGT